MTNFTQPFEHMQSLCKNGPPKLQLGAERFPDTQFHWYHGTTYSGTWLAEKDHHMLCVVICQ